MIAAAGGMIWSLVGWRSMGVGYECHDASCNGGCLVVQVVLWSIGGGECWPQNCSWTMFHSGLYLYVLIGFKHSP